MTSPNLHSFEIPDVRLVLVIAGNLRQFQHHFQIRTQMGPTRFGDTAYRYVSNREQLRGRDRATTRFMLVGEYWLKSDLIVHHPRPKGNED